jgi:hypothetical protein
MCSGGRPPGLDWGTPGRTDEWRRGADGHTGSTAVVSVTGSLSIELLGAGRQVDRIIDAVIFAPILRLREMA